MITRVVRFAAWMSVALCLAAPTYADSLGSASGGTAANQSSLSGCKYNVTPPTLTDGQQAAQQCDANGNVKTTATITAPAGGLPVVNSAATPTDRAGAITTGGTSQTLAAANAARKCLLIQNPSTATEQNIAAAENLYVNDSAVAATIAGAGNYAVLLPGMSTTFCPNNIVDQTAATVNAATTAHRWYAKEY